MRPGPDAAVVLAGGSGRRLGGVDKPSLTKHGRSLLDRVLAAVGDGPTVIVGPGRDLPAVHRQVREDPPGSGPAAAVAAGVWALADLDDHAVVTLLAADLPYVDHRTLARLTAALTDGTAPDARGAVLLDPAGRPQHLFGVWWLGALRGAVAVRPEWAGQPLHRLLAPLAVLGVTGGAEETSDIDTPDDLRRWQQDSPST